MQDSDHRGRPLRWPTLCIEPGLPWQYDCAESFNGRLRNELLNAKIVESLLREVRRVALAARVQPANAAQCAGLRSAVGLRISASCSYARGFALSPRVGNPMKHAGREYQSTITMVEWRVRGRSEVKA